MRLGKRAQGQYSIDDRLELPLLNQAAQFIQRGTRPLAIGKVNRHVFISEDMLGHRGMKSEAHIFCEESYDYT